ncbi:accessory Sec system S-layer assembly protein [Brevibacillus fluminis]|uniref:Accessory Sec system S-layer assembly protein n=1 Tax=Brevibacillus fluminis TaxID=511487 RepID=A0A3M8DX03_9BACL|nr:accessory Sec system S-layer assembly protein [Brevibacillus fluminis]RNB92666.1 accessory Sec system S-layer assembly protein [Brevibacillus fluminis]
MFSFLKNWRKNDAGQTTGTQETVKEESVMPAGEAGLKTPVPTAVPEQTEQATSLSLHPSWEKEMNAQQKYAMSFMANDLTAIQVGHVALAGIHLHPHEEGVEVTAFVRNGLPQPVRLGKMNLLVLIGDNELFARQEFDLAELDEIPAFSARPWSFIFRRENFLLKDVMLLNWKLAFELAQKKLVLPQQLELEESWIKALNDTQKNSLIELARNLPPLQPNEVNVQSVQLSLDEEGAYRALLLIRNGSEQALNFEKIPLSLHDAAGDIIAQGLFELGSLTVNPHTSKPWLFIFPKESIVKQDADISRWKTALIQ